MVTKTKRTKLKPLKKEVLSSTSSFIYLLLKRPKTEAFNLFVFKPFNKKTQTNKTTKRMVIQLLEYIILSSACTFLFW